MINEKLQKCVKELERRQIRPWATCGGPAESASLPVSACLSVCLSVSLTD